MDEKMTIEQARKMKRQLERQIAASLVEFKDQTGLIVERVDVDLVDLRGLSSVDDMAYGKVSVEVRL